MQNIHFGTRLYFYVPADNEFLTYQSEISHA